MDWDFFLAHASPDKPVAEALRLHLMPRWRVFLDRPALAPGDRWAQRIPEALLASRVVVALISRHTPKAHYAGEEFIMAVEAARKDRARVVPVWLDGVVDTAATAAYGLFGFQAVTLGAGGIPEVAAALGVILDPPPRWRPVGLNDIPAVGRAIEAALSGAALSDNEARLAEAARSFGLPGPSGPRGIRWQACLTAAWARGCMEAILDSAWKHAEAPDALKDCRIV